MRWIFCSLALLLGASQLFAQNLILNGNFDIPVPDNGTGGNWTSFNQQTVGWGSTFGNPGGGFRLNASGAIATDPTIVQTINSLTIGQSYTIDGQYLIHVPLGNPANSFGVLLDGLAILQLGNPGTTWTSFSIDFIASNTSHQIGFAAERNGSDHSYFIDNIQVTTAVPEPTSLAMIAGTAVISLIGYRRYRRIQFRIN